TSARPAATSTIPLSTAEAAPPLSSWEFHFSGRYRCTRASSRGGTRERRLWSWSQTRQRHRRSSPLRAPSQLHSAHDAERQTLNLGVASLDTSASRFQSPQVPADTWRFAMQMQRRTFLKGTAAVGVGLAFFDLSEARAELRLLKIDRTTETRSTCPYCAVSCGVIIHTLGDKAKNVTPSVVHVEGDPDHPINRGTLCPKGSTLKDDI